MIRRVPPPAWLASLAAVGFLFLLSALPNVQFDRVQVPASQPPVAVTYPCLSQEPEFYRYTLPVKPKDPRQVVPGAVYKESKGAFGSSAVPENIESLTPAQALAVVRQTFIDWHCGIDGLYGGDPVLHKVGLLASRPSLDIANYRWSTWDERARDLEAYLATINWNHSFVMQTSMPPGMWTLTMRDGQGQNAEPEVVAIQHQQPVSWYLALAVIQADGSVVYDWRRLECGFQPTYKTKGDVPPGVPHLR